MSARTFAGLDMPSALADASMELLTHSETMGRCVLRLKALPPDDQARETYAQRLLVLLGQQMACLKVVEGELERVFCGLQTDGDKLDEPGMRSLRDFLAISG